MINDRSEEIVEFLRNKIAEIAGNPQLESEFDDNGDIKEMGMDSVKTINLIVQIEQHFDIMFEDEELLIDNFSTVNRITSSIWGKMGAQV